MTHIRVGIVREEVYDMKKIKRNCIRKFREKAGLTQRALAKEVGTSQQPAR
jgi:predicted transcriptional regulator